MRKALFAFLFALSLVASSAFAKETAPVTTVPEAACSIASLPGSPAPFLGLQTLAVPLTGGNPACTNFVCRKPCMVNGCVGTCIDFQTCTCEIVCP
jgi:hypothetical protein